MTQKSDLFQIDVGNRMDFPHISIWTWSFCMSKRGGLPRRRGTGNIRWGRANSYFSSPMQSMRTGLTLTPPEETGYLLIMAQPGCAGDYQNRLLTTYPVCPLVREEALHADVRCALNALSNGGQIRKARMSSSFFPVDTGPDSSGDGMGKPGSHPVPQPDGTSDPIYFPALPRKFIAGDAVQPVRRQPLPSLRLFPGRSTLDFMHISILCGSITPRGCCKTPVLTS